MQNLATIICLIILSATSAVVAQNNQKNTITITVSNISSNDGKVFIGLYDSKENFLNKRYKGTISSIENNSCEVAIENVPDGVYAISIYHDENNNNTLDTGMFGIPKEDYGCSNGARGFMGPPKWEDAKFEIKGESINQHIKL